jgi:DNA-binding winged helix-turn-helix (wHTH) protein
MVVYEFDRFRVDPVRRLLLKEGSVLPIAPKSFDVLLALIEHRGSTVPYDRLIELVWRANASARTADNLKERVSRLRKALGDDRTIHKFIVTVPLEGYTFVPPVTVVAPGPSSVEVSPPVHSADQDIFAPLGEHQSTPSLESPATVLLPIGQPRAQPQTRRWPTTFLSGRVRAAVAKTIPIVGATILIAAFVVAVRMNGGAGRTRTEAALPILSGAEQRVSGDQVDELLQPYRGGLEVLRRNLALQFSFVVLGILMALQKGTDINVAPLKTTVSTTWLCLLVPLVLIYLWLDFGFVLDDLIKWRAEAWREIARTGVMVRASAFNDGGFMDGWFMCFRPTEHTINTNFLIGSAFFFCLMYYPLFAANHACSVVLLLLAVRRLPSGPLRLVPWFAGAVITLSHLQFWFGGSNPNWGQPAVAGLALVIGYALFSGISQAEGTPEPYAVTQPT